METCQGTDLFLDIYTQYNQTEFNTTRCNVISTCTTLADAFAASAGLPAPSAWLLESLPRPLPPLSLLGSLSWLCAPPVVEQGRDFKRSIDGESAGVFKQIH